MEEVVPKMARRSLYTIYGDTAPTSRHLNVMVRSSPLYPRVWPKWRENYPEGPDHPVAPNRLIVYRYKSENEIKIFCEYLYTGMLIYLSRYLDQDTAK